jgi:hypothetical protein
VADGVEYRGSSWLAQGRRVGGVDHRPVNLEHPDPGGKLGLALGEGVQGCGER